MPRNRGTSRKGKPKKYDRVAGMGRSLQKIHFQKQQRHNNGPFSSDGGMSMKEGMTSIGIGIGNDGHDNNGVHTNNNATTTNAKSILELNDLDDFLHQAEMANRQFVTERERFVVLDSTGTEYHQEAVGGPKVKWADDDDNDNEQPSSSSYSKVKKPYSSSSFVFTELSVPRRPTWDDHTSAEELDSRERESFLRWRRSIADREEELFRGGNNVNINNVNVRVTPFEKNLHVWRQLWRVVERSTCIVQIVDGRNPLFYVSTDLKVYVTDELAKPMVLLINKSDYLSSKQRQTWHTYLTDHKWHHVFFSAQSEQTKLDLLAAASNKKERNQHETMNPLWQQQNMTEIVEATTNENVEETESYRPTVEAAESLGTNVGVETPLTRHELLDWLTAFARAYNCDPDPRYDNRVQFGMVGFPNVGKSSVINVLVGSSKAAHGTVPRVGVASQPGKTKHFQTLLVPDRADVMLCDCPGLVFPSFVSNTADLIAAGVYPISQMRDFWPVVELICRRIPREILNAQYGIHLPVPTPQELRERRLDRLPPPTAEELLDTFCAARSMYATASGVPDYQRASRLVIKDYADGKLLYCHPPPSVVEGTAASLDATSFHLETVYTALSNTTKLQEKLAPLLDQAASTRGGNVASSVEEDGGELEDVGIQDDFDLLELVDGQPDTGAAQPNGGKRGKSHKSRQKHGRKGRRDRNKDPYGCHSTPDDVLDPSARSSGLIVNAGKYGRKNYTRASGYGGARSAPAAL